MPKISMMDAILDEAELTAHLIAHIQESHSGDVAARERTIALVHEHLHWREQRGLRTAVSLARRLSEVTKHPEAVRVLKAVADTLDGLVMTNDAAPTRAFLRDNPDVHALIGP